MKRGLIFLTILLILSMLLTGVSAASTGGLPKDYSKINGLYLKAVKEKNNANIILYGGQVTALFNGSTDNKQKLDIIVPIFLNMAKAYEALGPANKANYYSAAETYVKYTENLEKQRLLNPKNSTLDANGAIRYMLYSNAGRIYFDILKDYDQALLIYERVLKYEPDNSGVTAKFFELAKIYEEQGNYETAQVLFKKYIPRAEKLGWKDGVTYAKSKLNSIHFDLELYTKSTDLSQSIYYGAKNESKSGIYFGSGYNADPRISTFDWNKIKVFFPKKNSTYLTYLHWEEEAKSFDRYYKDAKANHIALEVAWNIDNKDIDKVLKNIESYKAYIERTAQYYGELDIPIFLRFAGEMNIKENSADSAAYVKAYRYVADIVRSKAPKVALVWSPNDVSAKGRTYQEYYPGDEYVDWVGISSYSSKYFQGKKNWGSLQETIDTVYMTGDNANPLAKIKPIIDLYGDRKPIMLSETGISHYTKLEKEDLTTWAETQLKRLYVYGPMLYPQLKGIYYFNVDNSIVTPQDNYALYTNSKINKLYNDLVSSPYFVTEVGTSSDFTYIKLSDNTINSLDIPIFTYTIVPKLLNPTIQYKLDGKLFDTKTELPYETQLQASKLAAGTHILTVEVYNGNKMLKSRDYTVVASSNSVTIKAK